uniref:Metalloendopeptidase n=1 Tax=Plectus sambesii TaxID=2011161 RepID=A0A914UN48_9BILA
MHALGAIAFIAFCIIHAAFGVDEPKVLELKNDINYAKIRQSFPNTPDAVLLNRRTKLESLNNKVISSIRKNLAPLNVTKNPKFDNLPGTPKDISVINGPIAPYLYQMDIELTDEQLNEVVSSDRKKRKATSYPSYKWPTKATGVIPYFFAANITSQKITIIQTAIKFWEDNTCLKFQLNGAGSNSLLFYNSPSCKSWIGMVGGQQGISIGDDCQNLGIITHEIGHALGFYHEQSRYDRDTYVSVNLANVETINAGNFAKATSAQMNLYNTPYDYGSVMHYGYEDFAIDSSIPVLIAADPRHRQTMGQRRAPSFLDVLTMNRHYGCDALCASYTTVCENGGYKDPNNCNQCKCPASFGGAFCQILAPAENGVCGASLTATTAWQSFSDTVGTTSTTDTPTTCYWHLNSPAGTTMEVKLTLTGGSCNAGCFWNSVEIKLDNDYTKTGIRHCCLADYSSTPYVSMTNKVPIIVYGNYQTAFTIQYRYVAAVTPAPTTTPATLNSCPSGQLFSTRTNSCISQCTSQVTSVTADWTQNQMSNAWLKPIPSSPHCYWPVLAPVGTRIEYQYPAVPGRVYAECTPGCTSTSFQVSDNYQTPSSTLYCCPNTLATLQGTTTSNLLLVVLYADNAGRGVSIVLNVRYIGTPSVTTVAPTGTCPVSGQISFRNQCIVPCPSLPLYQATAAWQSAALGPFSNYQPGCYIPFTGPAGTKAQVNVTSITTSSCSAGCAVTAVTFSDNMQPAVGTTYCCASDKPSFTATTNKAMLVIAGDLQLNFAYRYTT